MLKAVLFDLDGTLLPMDQDEFVKYYFGAMANKFATKGIDAKLLMKAVIAGTDAMVKNDGTVKNEVCFWNVFDQIMQMDHRVLENDFIDFYENEFDTVKKACGFNPHSREVIELFKQKGIRLICATNPLFPEIATKKRIQWAGLNVDDFELITTYEKCSFCKPNPEYYAEILRICGLNSDEVIMVGNDVQEDMVAKTIGIDVALITDNLIHRKDNDIQAYFVGTMEEFKAFIPTLA